MATAVGAIGLPLLVVVLYSDISKILIRSFGVPSPLQFLIALLTIGSLFTAAGLSRWRSTLAHPAFLLFTGYAVVVYTTSIWAPVARYADERLTETAKALMIGALIVVLTDSWQRLRQVAVAIVATATILSAVSLLQILTGAFDPAFGGLLLRETGTIYGDVAAPRAAGPPVSDPNFYARLLLIALPLAGVAAMLDGVSKRQRFFAIAAAMTILAAVLVTYSRGAMLSLAVAGACLAFSARIRPRFVLLGILLAAGVLLLLPGDVTKRLLSVETAIGSELERHDSSVEKRRLLLRSGLAMFLDQPLTGIGAGHFGHAYPTYSNRVGSPFTDYHPPGTSEYPHGLYLEIASETGILGLLTFCGALLAAGIAIVRARSRLLAASENHALFATGIGVALVGYLTASVFLHETHLRYPGLLIGLAVAVSRLSRAPEQENFDEPVVEPTEELTEASSLISSLDWGALGLSSPRVSQLHGRTDSRVILLTASRDGAVERVVLKQQKTRPRESRPASERAAHEHDVLVMLHERMSSSVSDDGWTHSVPQPMAIDPDEATVVLAHASGTALDVLIKRSKRDPEAARLLLQAVRQTGVWLRQMQRHTRQPIDARESKEALIEVAQRDLELIAAREWRVRRRRTDIARRLERSAGRVDVTGIELTGHHGDFWPGNIFVSERRIEVIDLEGYRPGLSMQDVAYFHLFLDLMFPLHRSHIPALQREFLDGYGLDRKAAAPGFELCLLTTNLRMLAHKLREPLRSPGDLWTRVRLTSLLLGRSGLHRG